MERPTKSSGPIQADGNDEARCCGAAYQFSLERSSFAAKVEGRHAVRFSVPPSCQVAR